MWLLTSLLCLSPLLAHGYQKEIVGIMGENFTFPVQIDQKIVDIVWKKNKDKVAEWEDQNKPTYYGNFSSRSELMKNGSLTIVNLEKDDAGIYELVYWNSMEEHSLNFKLVVLDSLPKPEINCSTSDDELVLNCTANFQASLNYIWKLSNNPHRCQKQHISIPLKTVDITTSATCIIKYSQTERSSEISLIQCLPEEKGDSSHKRHRNILIFFLTAPIILLVILECLRRKGVIKLGRNTAQNDSPVNGSGEHEQLYPGNSQQQGNSETACGSEPTEVETMDEPESEKTRRMAASSLTVHDDNEEPEADRPLNNDRALKDKQIVENGVNQGEVTQDAEGENGVHLDSSSNCTK